MKIRTWIVAAAALAGCGKNDSSKNASAKSATAAPIAEVSKAPAKAGPATKPERTIGPKLADERKKFTSKLQPRESKKEPAPEPPAELFKKVAYEAQPGKLGAYLSPDPGDGKKHPAIIWIVGGDVNSIGEVWEPGPEDNDQTASAYRNAGIIMMFPSLRGGNDNPGAAEGFLGEVDDVIAAANHLAAVPYVDSQRIYLGGHSTGGTLALLVAEMSDRFRVVFSFGPTHSMMAYPAEFLPFDRSNVQEMYIRSPYFWIDSIRSPVYVFEGTEEGNLRALQEMSLANRENFAHFIPVEGANHFNLLAPINRLLAQKILKDEGETSNISVTEEEINALFKKK